jgi:Zn-dependent peptidase ImmA (M78 family)
VEEAAKFLRNKWNLGTDPIYNAVELLEDNHIKVVELEEVDGFDGLQTWVNGNIPVIVINKSRLKKEDRKRFTVMHELGHLLLIGIKELPEVQQEKLCHQFAAAMLFPAEAMINELGEKRNRLLIQELGTLKQQYGISIQAIVMRAKDLEIISENYCKQFFFYLKQMHWKVEEPKDYDYEGTERATRFTQLIFRALAEELISMSKAASLSNQKLAEFRSESLMVR